MYTAIHETPLGAMMSRWTETGLYSLDWNVDESVELCETESSRCLDALLNEYFQSGVAEFEPLTLDPHGWSDFNRSVYQACRQIPAGRTTTYKQLAIDAGSPGASRAVGAAMARNRILLVIPCHRVLSTGGGLRGFSAPGGLETKRYLLDLEDKQSRFNLETSC